MWGAVSCACARGILGPGSAGLGSSSSCWGAGLPGGPVGLPEDVRAGSQHGPQETQPSAITPLSGRSGLEGRGLESVAGQDLRGGSKTGFGVLGAGTPLRGSLSFGSSLSGLLTPRGLGPTVHLGLLLCPTVTILSPPAPGGPGGGPYGSGSLGPRWRQGGEDEPPQVQGWSRALRMGGLPPSGTQRH